MTTRPGLSEMKNVHHWNPKALGLRQSFCYALFCFKAIYMLAAISKLCFIYCAKSFELIGDCCDSAIFRIFRSVTSLWN